MSLKAHVYKGPCTSLTSATQESYFQAQRPGAFAIFQLELSALYFKNSLKSETEILIYSPPPPKLLLVNTTLNISEQRDSQGWLWIRQVLKFLRGK